MDKMELSVASIWFGREFPFLFDKTDTFTAHISISFLVFQTLTWATQ